MADLVTQFPLINNIRFTQYPYIPVPNQTIVQFDQAPFIDTIKPWQTVPVISQYAIPATFLDQWTIMVNISNSFDNTLSFNLLDSTGTLIYANIGIGEEQIVTGNTYTNPITGDVTQLATWLYNISVGGLLDPVADNGSIFYLEMIRSYSDGDTVNFTQTWRSEPILIQQDHANTLLLTAAYTTNKNDVIINNWSTVNPVFRSRVYADIRQFNPTGVQYAYLQQEYEQITQTSHQSRIYDFIVGDNGTSTTYGVPDWMLERVTAALLADNLLIDNKWFMRVSEGGSWGNMWKKEDSDNVPLITATTKIREVWNNQATTTTNSVINVFGDDYAPLPFAETPCVMKNQFTLNTVTVPYQIYYAESDFDAMVNYLNTVVVPANNMSGIFYKTIVSASFGIIYQNGYGENWYILTSPTKLTAYFSFWHTYSIFDTFGCKLGSTGGASPAIVDFGDKPFPYNKQLVSSSFDIVMPRTTTSGQALCRVFHNNDLYFFGSNYLSLGTTGCIFDQYPTYQLGGYLSSATSSLTISNYRYANAFGTTGDAFNGICNVSSLLEHCFGTIQSMDLSNNYITDFVPNLLFIDYNFSSLNYIDISSNCLDSAAVDALFNSFYAGTTYVTTGAFWNCSNQLTNTGLPAPAPPTAASATARAALIAAGWTLVTD